MDDNIDNFLTHHGVKGMKWGKRRTDAQLEKASSGSDSAPKKGKHTESRKEYRQRTKAEKSEFYNEKVDKVASRAMAKGDDVLISTRYAGDTVATITTGKEFVESLSRGRAFDITMTEVYAEKTSEGPYQMTGERTVYKKGGRR